MTSTSSARCATGDEFELFYGNPITGTSRNRKVLLYASLDYAGGNKTYYRFTTPDDGQTDYYDEKRPQRHQGSCARRRSPAPA